MDVPASIR